MIPGIPSIIYISGPMSGLPKFNFASFDKAQKIWEKRGARVLSPAQTSRAVGYTEESDPTTPLGRADLQHLLLIDIASLYYADAIGMLPGWERSMGATVELSIAQFLKMPVYDAYTCLTFVPLVKPWSELTAATELIGKIRDGLQK